MKIDKESAVFTVVAIAVWFLANSAFSTSKSPAEYDAEAKVVLERALENQNNYNARMGSGTSTSFTPCENTSCVDSSELPDHVYVQVSHEGYRLQSVIRAFSDRGSGIMWEWRKKIDEDDIQKVPVTDETRKHAALARLATPAGMDFYFVIYIFVALTGWGFLREKILAPRPTAAERRAARTVAYLERKDKQSATKTESP